MKFKSFLSFFLALIISFSLCSCEAEVEEDTSLITPLLYEVTDSENGKVWLFGSVHVGEESFYPLPRYVLNAFKKADVLAVELDIINFKNNDYFQSLAFSKLSYKDGSTIKDHIPPFLYDDALEILKEHNLYNQSLDYYYPALWADYIDSARYLKLGINKELGIDRYFINNKGKKQLSEIESAKEQYTMLASFSETVQSSLLYSAVNDYNEPIEESSLKELMALWAAGDEAALTEKLRKPEKFSSEEQKNLYNEYYKAAVTDRNLKMTDYAEEALLSGKETFICVGAAHIIGEGSIVEQLKARGYTVTTIKGAPKTETSSSLPASN